MWGRVLVLSGSRERELECSVWSRAGLWGLLSREE